jgi:hypothetical protein
VAGSRAEANIAPNGDPLARHFPYLAWLNLANRLNQPRDKSAKSFRGLIGHAQHDHGELS